MTTYERRPDDPRLVYPEGPQTPGVSAIPEGTYVDDALEWSDFAAWLDYCEVDIPEFADLAGVTERDLYLILYPLTVEDLRGWELAVRAQGPTHRFWPDAELAVHAGWTVDKFRTVTAALLESSQDGYEAVLKAFHEMIGTKGRAKLIAYGIEHPGFEVQTVP